MDTQVILISAVSVLAIILFGWLWRWYRKRRARKIIDQLPIKMVESPTAKDREAYELLRNYRRETWKEFGEDISLNPQALYQTAYEVIGMIAAVYHPEAEEPQFKANIDGLLDLNRRILQRVGDLLDKPIIGKLRDLDVATVLSLKKGYEKVRRHPITEFFMSKPALRKLWSVGWGAANLLNPWYWGRKVFVEVGLETGKRYLVTGLVTIVGEEAVMLYSGRRIRNEKAAAQMLTACEMIRTLRGQKSVSAREYEVLLRWFFKFKHIDSVAKLNLLRLLIEPRQMPEQEVSEIVNFGGQKTLLKAFGELAEAEGPDQASKKKRLEEIRTAVT